MRARHRHFNARDAGAGLVLDARYINQGNATSVSTWVDRGLGGNNATQTNAGNQPTYQSGAIGGQAAVRFDGTDDFLDSAHLISGQTNRTIIVTYKQTKSISQQQSPFGTQTNLGANTFQFFFITSEISTRFNGANQIYDAAVNVNETAIISTNSSGSTFASVGVRKNGLSLSITSQNNNTNTINTQGSSKVGVYFQTFAAQQFFGGDIGCIISAPQNLPTPLLRRVEHACAFSFKQSCN
jgi:hypothetical protein